ncbi:Metal-dependent hydrolase, composite domain superfamily [Sesbania bispinosa]|nr:Metal-dependent hydrolase, composite domain superfamily [Sesbania bispinosa]
MLEREKDRKMVTVLHGCVIITMDGEQRVFRNGGIVIEQDKIKAIGQSVHILAEFSHVADHVTCFAEAGGQHVSGMARAVHLLGLRACLTQSTMDSGHGLPSSWATRTTHDCLQSQKDNYEKHHNTAQGRIRIWFGIRQIMNSTDRLLLDTRDAARQLKTGIHMHVAEIPYENQVVMDVHKINHGTVTYLEKIDFLQNNLLAAHSVWVDNNEISLLSRAGVKVSHCPAAAMRMLGFAPVREMLDAGICVSIGTDGAPSNNRMSIVDEMYLTSLINKGREVYANGTTDPTALPAETILRMVTVNGAKSVLWDDELGSLEVGKKADIVVINPSSWPMVPVHDCISSIVYCMRTENVVSVMCNGLWIMKDKKIINVDEEEVILKAKQASVELLKRAGIKLPTRMNPFLMDLCPRGVGRLFDAEPLTSCKRKRVAVLHGHIHVVALDDATATNHEARG